MKLEEIFPEKVEVNLPSSKIKLKLKLIKVADELWIDETFGKGKLKEIIENADLRSLARIMFRLLDTESKLLLKDLSVTDEDEDFKVTELVLNGPEKLLYLMAGEKDLIAMLNGLIKSKDRSSPDIEELIKQGEAKKKEMS